MRATTYHIFVSGRVQGVGYRRFAQKEAQSRRIYGWTRNLLDGRVEIIAQGEEKSLDEYCESLKKGPAFSLVREVIIKMTDDEGTMDHLNPSEFEIRPDVELK
jgi:acylphosphatase